MNTESKAMLGGAILCLTTAVVIAVVTARKANKLALAYIKEGRALDKANAEPSAA